MMAHTYYGAVKQRSVVSYEEVVHSLNQAVTKMRVPLISFEYFRENICLVSLDNKSRELLGHNASHVSNRC